MSDHTDWRREGTIFQCRAHGVVGCHARECWDGDQELSDPPEDMVIRDATGAVVAHHSIGRARGGKSMPPPRRTLGITTNADSRPRIHLCCRMLEDDKIEIGYRTNVRSVWRWMPSIEMALADALGGDILEHAVLIWEGNGETPA